MSEESKANVLQKPKMKYLMVPIPEKLIVSNMRINIMSHFAGGEPKLLPFILEKATQDVVDSSKAKNAIESLETAENIIAELQADLKESKAQVEELTLEADKKTGGAEEIAIDLEKALGTIDNQKKELKNLNEKLSKKK